ncbi:MAG: ABC transporter permease [Myxococcaceae bacterium]
MISVSLKLALRSLGRNARRTLLSVVGIGVGCAMAATVASFTRGRTEVYGRLAAESGAGHLRIVPAGWLPGREDKLRLADPERALAAARALPGATVAAPRARTQALLAMGTRVQGVELVGVDPEAEPRALRLVRKVVAGRYLEPSDRGAVVLGQELAARLRVEVGDPLVVTAVGQGGAMQSAMLEVVGLTSSGSKEVDAGIAHVNLPDIEPLTGIGGIGEIAILLSGSRKLEAARAALEVPPGDVVLTWEDIEPSLANHFKADAGTSRIYIGIVVFMVLLGVASAQLTAALERRREFAVLAAIGMRSRQMIRQQLFEALVLGFAGAAAALVIAVPLVWRLHVVGIDLTRLIGQQMSVEGVLFEPKIYADFGWWIAGNVLALSLIATGLASIYPALFAARTDPATALRVAQ